MIPGMFLRDCLSIKERWQYKGRGEAPAARAMPMRSTEIESADVAKGTRFTSKFY